MKIDSNKNKIYSVITVVLILVLWFTFTNFNEIPYVILPKPQDVWNSFVGLCVNGYGINKDLLIVHLFASMRRLFIAFGISVITAIPLGLFAGVFAPFSSAFSPLIDFYRPIPPLAYYTLLVLWLGITELSKIMLLFLAGFAPIFVVCCASVRRVNTDYIRASKMLGASDFQTFFNVILPAVLPDIFTGVRTAIGVEYTTLVAAEMVAAKTGIGWMVLDASNWLKSDVVFVGVIIMGVTGIILNQFILIIEKHIVHWAGK